MKYEGIVYRPPSEARSLIIQVTIGCAHNGCTFCTMYKDKKFRIRSREEMRIFLEHVDSEGCVFRANHASNYILLKGTLNADIPQMQEYLRQMEHEKRFRNENMRSL